MPKNEPAIDRKPMHVARFMVAFGGGGCIEVQHAMCAVCKLEKIVIAIDSSLGEYGPGCICADCANDAVTVYAEQWEK